MDAGDLFLLVLSMWLLEYSFPSEGIANPLMYTFAATRRRVRLATAY
jgi:hypothetical protein